MASAKPCAICFDLGLLPLRTTQLPEEDRSQLTHGTSTGGIGWCKKNRIPDLAPLHSFNYNSLEIGQNQQGAASDPRWDPKSSFGRKRAETDS
jgi:hypothetical protein